MVSLLGTNVQVGRYIGIGAYNDKHLNYTFILLAVKDFDHQIFYVFK